MSRCPKDFDALYADIATAEASNCKLEIEPFRGKPVAQLFIIARKAEVEYAGLS